LGVKRRHGDGTVASQIALANRWDANYIQTKSEAKGTTYYTLIEGNINIRYWWSYIYH